MADMNLYLVVAITIALGTGLALLFFGALIAIASAFACKRVVWGSICILVLPVTLAYVMLYWDETQYPRKYLLPGAGLVILSALCIAVL